MKKRIRLSLTVMLFVTQIAWGQSDTLDYYSLSLEELMNIKIVSASKKSENLFDAPLSASVLTKEEIERSGATSIMEALRLMPGLIVRQLTNGNYDVNIRGLDNVPPNSLVLASGNTTTLVMINNRPVYNYLQGGIFWETLPVDLNDVEKIEVVRGPSSTLYGPNAVSGVINIITRKTEKDGVNAAASLQYGSMNTSIVNGSLGYQFNNKLNATISGNYQLRKRDVTYYDFETDTWVNDINLLSHPDPSSRYPHPDRAMDKNGVNAFINYEPREKLQFNFAAGLQRSEIQTVTFDSYLSSVHTSRSSTGYAELRSNIHDINTHFAYAAGSQSVVVGYPGSKYDFETFDAVVDYEWKITNFSVKPGVSFRNAIYDDTRYWDASLNEGILNGREYMENIGVSIQTEYKIWKEKIRLIGGVRADQFTHPDKWFYSYEGAASIKPNDKHLIRLVYSSAYRSPFILDTYQNLSIRTPLDPSDPEGPATETYILGNKNLKLLSSQMVELGYRIKLFKNIYADVDVYSIRTNDYSGLVMGATSPSANYPVVATTPLQTQNLTVDVHQRGTSIAFNIVLEKIQVKPFVTIQKTTLDDYSMYSNTSDAVPTARNDYNPAMNNVNSGNGVTTDHAFTPSVYGGAYINFKASEKINLNVNAYYMGKQTFYHDDNLEHRDGIRGIENIDAKLLLNARISYAPVEKISIFINARNVLNNDEREYFRSDRVNSMLLGGVSFRY